jgi:hypothetical protein
VRFPAKFSDRRSCCEVLSSPRCRSRCSHRGSSRRRRFQVFNVWETCENFERFIQDRLRPAQVAVLGEERVAALPDADIVHVAIHNYLIP